MPGYGRETLQLVRDNARWLSGGFGGLYMLATLASALTLPWLGRTLDLMPGWKVVRFTMPALALACVLIAVARSVVLLTLALYLLRLFGQGMMTETAFTEAGRWFVANRGRAMSLIVPGQQAGSAILPIFVVLIDRASGNWRTAWIASAALVIVIGLPTIMALIRVARVPESPAAKAPVSPVARELKLLPYFLVPLAFAAAVVGLVTSVWGVYLFMFLLGIASGFTSTLLGALWPEVYGLANLGGIRAIIVSAMVLSTAIGPGLSGALIDRGVSLPTQML